ncbi:CHC2 zinc finger domain-containing protein [Macellibacteroides fermentans]|uniref:DNA primase, catalytic core n=1 Tax=Parabacteroides chartae TaxID=1037355 RepID=A0A1T5AN59_9BACT|nr:CHC2 zinc finger domain-containing protein [Parabacteroides chartae]SKB36237.1 DNA primase, catalytic core [Parabacteroides chartae]
MSDLKSRVFMVKDFVRIQDLVAEYTGLGKEQNGKFMVRCPFHGENNPSMVVRIHNKTFKCYACGVAGDVFGFVMEMTGCSFYEALTSLEARAGISPPAQYNSSAKPLTPKSKAAANSLTSNSRSSDPKPAATSLPPNGSASSSGLTASGSPASTSDSNTAAAITIVTASSDGAASSPSPSGNPASGSSSNTADAMALTPGGASDGTLFGFGGVKKEVKKEEGLSRVMLIELNTDFLKVLGGYDPQCEGLLKVYVDFEVGVSPWHWSYRGDKLFKGMLDRVVFPLRDAQGVLVGFSARHKSALPPPDGWGKGCPKYINSAGSELFKKRELLYGLHRTDKAIRLRGFAFLVEGYKDVLAMVAAGFGNTAGLCGLEITEGHLDLLAGLCTRVVLLTDGDVRGQAAVPKFEGLLKGAGFGVLSLSLPDGEDPDSLFRQLGAEGLRTLIESLLCPPRLLSPVLPPSNSMSEDSVLLSVSDKLISPLPEPDFRTEEVVLPCSEQEKSSPTAVSEPYLAEAKSSFDGAKSIPAEVSESSLAEAKLSFDGIESSPAAVESAAVSEEDLLIRDVDSLVASLAYVARPTEKQRMIARLSSLREQLVKVSALLNRPPSVL